MRIRNNIAVKITAVLLCFGFLPAVFPALTAQAASEIMINSTDVTIYSMYSGYSGYLTIPKEYQLEVTGTENVTYSVPWEYYFDIACSDGLIMPSSDLRGDDITAKVIVNADGKQFEVNVTVVDYAQIYADKIMEDYLAENITKDMTVEEKLRKIGDFIGSYEYSTEMSSAAGMIITGGGDCWASTDAAVRMCHMLGIDAWERLANKHEGASGHTNACAHMGDYYYIIEAGSYGSAPRDYNIYKRPTPFSCVQQGENETWVYQYDDCDAQGSFVIPGEIDGRIVTGIDEAFSDGSRLEKVTSITIPASVTSIGSSAFDCCESLREFIVEKGNPAYKAIDGVLYSADGKMLIRVPCAYPETSFDIPAGVTEMEDSAFSMCEALTDVSVPEGITRISEYAFANCASLRHIKLPSTLTEIGAAAFCFCRVLEDFELPKSLKTIEEGAFNECDGFRDVVIPDGVMTIPDEAFIYASYINTVVIPKSVKAVEEKAFAMIPGISLLYEGTEEEWKNVTIAENYADYSDAKIFFNAGSIAPEWTITFSSDESNVPSPQKKQFGRDTVITEEIPASENWWRKFKCWNTEKDGGGDDYYPGDSFGENGDSVLYAMWEDKEYLLTYNANGGSGAPEARMITMSGSLELSDKVPTKQGYTFVCWNTMKSGQGWSYQPGDTLLGIGEVTLYALWKPDTYVITFDANGGKGAPAAQTKIHGEDLILSSEKPSRDGYTFTGWDTAKDGSGKDYAPGNTFSSNGKATLYAQWSKNSAPTDPTTPPTGGVQLKRLAGDGRQQTAALISKEAFTTAENVFIASGDNAADALAGVPLAYAMNAPILLIRPAAGLDKDTKAEIQRLKAKNVYILGGEGAIPAKVEKDIQTLGCKTSRIAGDDRFDTAVKIAEKLKSIKGNPTEVFFVYSHNYPDALAVSGVAAVKGAPILYVYSDGDLRASAEFMKNTKSVEYAYIIGGYGAIKEAADKNVEAYAFVQRVYGDNRYLTCEEINKFFASVLTGKAVCIATGKNFPDALAGGVLAAKTKSPMLLVGDSLLDYQSAYIKAKKPNTLYVFGGTGAVPDAIADNAVKAAK